MARYKTPLHHESAGDITEVLYGNADTLSTSSALDVAGMGANFLPYGGAISTLLAGGGEYYRGIEAWDRELHRNPSLRAAIADSANLDPEFARYCATSVTAEDAMRCGIYNRVLQHDIDSDEAAVEHTLAGVGASTAVGAVAGGAVGGLPGLVIGGVAGIGSQMAYDKFFKSERSQRVLMALSVMENYQHDEQGHPLGMVVADEASTELYMAMVRGSDETVMAYAYATGWKPEGGTPMQAHLAQVLDEHMHEVAVSKASGGHAVTHTRLEKAYAHGETRERLQNLLRVDMNDMEVSQSIGAKYMQWMQQAQPPLTFADMAVGNMEKKLMQREQYLAGVHEHAPQSELDRIAMNLRGQGVAATPGYAGIGGIPRPAQEVSNPLKI